MVSNPGLLRIILENGVKVCFICCFKMWIKHYFLLDSDTQQNKKEIVWDCKNHKIKKIYMKCNIKL